MARDEEGEIDRRHCQKIYYHQWLGGGVDAPAPGAFFPNGRILDADPKAKRILDGENRHRDDFQQL